ncbi:ketoacyl-ACP synthase III [Micromonospora soli]|uniref:3-oxoacyl-ACP synthase III family protein n=1 Tax=Micromonospora sp. NBRC 110009 TaxID=3061627 RepID=UPI002670FF26|nr:ketoacyl-ACP synthase III [Micromonospora sp. NBRC 110009]WKT99068.1 ketoacyl-ACP synthase III [Micromonospora sp. NBRC 110009]
MTAERQIGIIGTGSYLPERAVPNEQIAQLVGVTPDWIERKTHIQERRFAAPSQAASDLAAAAAVRALCDAGLEASRMDYLIVATSTGDSPQPPTAHLVQHLLGAWNAACLDLNVVCAGFVYALDVARALVATRPGAHALVVGVDVYSRTLDFQDRATAVLFGDGAGAAVVGPAPDGYGLIDFELTSRGDANQLIRIEAGGSRRPASPQTIAAGHHFFRMQGRAVREFVAAQVPPAIAALLARNDVLPSMVEHFVPHQANGVMLDELVKHAGLTEAVVHRTLERYGNTGCASVAVTLDEANRSGTLHAGDLVLLTAFGGGMSVGACLLRWSDLAGARGFAQPAGALRLADLLGLGPG